MKIGVRRFLERFGLTYFVLFCLAYCIYRYSYAEIDPFIKKTDIPKFLAPALRSADSLPQCALMVEATHQELFKVRSIKPSYNKTEISPGGGWRPSHCLSQHKIAIIIPYRRREEHLAILMTYIHGFLQAQLIDYQIYVIEQSEKLPLNRGLLRNIGYSEVMKRHQIPCFIFHDVDLLPENTENVYGGTIQPRHMASSVNTLDYQLPYEALIGGVVSFLQEQFQAVNGFSNKYFGWGGEDDDLYWRTVNRRMKILRFEPSVSRYYMLPHGKDTQAPENIIRVHHAIDNQDIDGLNTLDNAYNLITIEEKQLYTLLKVDVMNPND